MESSAGSSGLHAATQATSLADPALHTSGSTVTVDEQPAKKSKAETTPVPSSSPQPMKSSTAPATVAVSRSASSDAIPVSSALLNARLKKELRELWAASRSPATHRTLPENRDVASLIPPFKVGTLEMYKRFPQAYDLLMHHHNCSAVQRALLHDILGRIERTAAAPAEVNDSLAPRQHSAQPWIRVADFGCGTGRIEAMVAQHPAVQAIYAYDGEVAMLKQCLVNTVRSAAQSNHCSSVRLAPVATTAPVDVLSASAPSVVLCADDNAPAGAELQLCVRPVPFQAIQSGFLADSHHPRCSLMVCAWSLSYVMRMQWGDDHWHAAVDAVVQAMVDQLDTSASDAALVILETLGNGSAEPTRQNTYTQRLEEHFGFTRTWVRTDYEFATNADAERMVRFFFGDKMLSKLTTDADSERCRLMECTGIWTLWKPRQC